MPNNLHQGYWRNTNMMIELQISGTKLIRGSDYDICNYPVFHFHKKIVKIVFSNPVISVN